MNYLAFAVVQLILLTTCRQVLSFFSCTGGWGHILPDLHLRAGDAHITIQGDYTDDQFQNRPTRVLIHGWRKNHAGSGKFSDILDAYKQHHKDKFNLVSVTWNSGSPSYDYAREFAKDNLARDVIKFLDKHLGSNSQAWSDLKIIGHGMGAHAAGLIGKRVTGGKVGTIIALDPTAKGYKSSEQTDKYRLSKTDAEYTECIHTNAGCYGIGEPVCTVNFYPNMGIDQHGCDHDDGCDHSRGYRLFAESLDKNKFHGMKCKRRVKDCSTDVRAWMGGEPGNKNKNVEPGIYYFQTNGSPPFGKGQLQES